MDKSLIITLSGEPGAGKTTVVNELKRLYVDKGFQVQTHSVGQIFRRIADNLGISISELNKQAAIRPEIDKMVDNELLEYSKKINSQPSPNTVYIIDSRMAWKFIDNSFSVRLKVPSSEAGKRIFADSTRTQADKYKSVEDAITETETRKQDEIVRYQKLYGCDLSNVNNYELVINTQNAKPSEIAKLISVCANLKNKDKFFPKMWEGNGCSIIPSKIQFSQKSNSSQEMQR